jgi:protein involved in polysaccharide export with SLBB domain
VLGAVVKKGAFPLNRPLTLIEAVAQAQGLETRVMDRSLVVQADLANSFISRQGQHLPVDFKKLFAEGDLSQNIAIEPDDYLYFPPYERAQIYVLGEVRYPGGLTAAGRTGTMEAIAVRGGFSERAWPKRLLVIRGSLQKPQTFIVNANDILAAKSPDFQLQPRDIIYVSSRPWYKAEELLDLAATAFVQSAVVTKTGLSVTPIGTR